jgi:cystathionine gamma-synthase
LNAILITAIEKLIQAPGWRASALGTPLPDSPHANSVCLPTWRDVVDYEEKAPRVMKKLRAGYPRFVVPALCADVFAEALEKYGRPGELCHAYPSERGAKRCARLIETWSGHPARVRVWPQHKVSLVFFPEEAEAAALKYWRHSGDGISSRQAAFMLSGSKQRPDADAARRSIKERISHIAGVTPDNVFLFKSGMAAIYTLHRMLMRMKPDSACAQFGFPYVDTLKIQQDFGFRSVFLPLGNTADLKALDRMMTIDEVGGVLCEFPSNPLLHSPDLHALAKLARRHQVPLVVDDTVSGWANVNVLAAADVVVTSLTKFFTGAGDVMGGAVILNPQSPIIGPMHKAFREEYEDTTWPETLEIMEQQSRDYVERMRRINATAEEVCAWLAKRPEIDQLYYPALLDREVYDGFKKPGGGCGGLFSIVLKNAAQATPLFYDHLEISKGPNLGTSFSLCCPFTLLAHYQELDWAEQCGVSRYLLRFSVGLEEPAELIARLERAFHSIGA